MDSMMCRPSVMLPGLDGIGLAQALRQTETNISEWGS